MAVVASNLLTDGDAAFVRVDNRRPPHALEPGVLAAAVNCRLDQGKPRPRYGVAVDTWGIPGANVINVQSFADVEDASDAWFVCEVSGFEVGRQYVWVQGNATAMSDQSEVVATGDQPAGTIWYASRTFIATQTTYYLWTQDFPNTACTSEFRVTGRTLAYARFNDPVTNTDCGILLTDGWRDDDGEDGGRGRAWRIIPGNAPQQISLNGHDLWDTCRLIQCHNAMVLLRHGDGGRHYFTADDVADPTNDRIQLHLTPPWGLGTARRVRFELAEDGSAIYGSTPPAAGNYYYAKHVAGDQIELYTDPALTNKLDYSIAPDAPVGRFYIEYGTDPAPFFGNGAPPLIMQPSDVQSAFEVGFVAVPEAVAVTDTTTSSISAPTHRLVPGDEVEFTGLTIGTGGPSYYAYPTSLHTISIHTDQADALTGANPISDITASGSGSLTKAGAAGIPMPPGREGLYYAGRLLLVNQRDQLVISDPFDFLHFTLFTGQVNANLGESGRVNWLLPLGEDVVLIGKETAILAIANLNQASSNWRMSDVTREYGGLAPLAALNSGSDVWLLSRKGVASIVRTVAGERLGVVRTVSHAVPQYFEDVDWLHAGQSCAAIWNNRFFLALPLKGQDVITKAQYLYNVANELPVADAPQFDFQNNRLLVLNFLNQSLQVNQTTVGGQIIGGVTETDASVDSWEGYWEGANLVPVAFARLNVNGDERLTFATSDGQIYWFHDGWDDAGEDISLSLATRGYFGGSEVLCLRGNVNWDTFNPNVTVTLQMAGYNEATTLLNGLTYDRTEYLRANQPAYDPDTSTEAQFQSPGRADYSTSASELTVGALDVHQNITEPLWMRERDRAPQITIQNTQGSLRVNSITLNARPAGRLGTTQA